MSVLIIVSNAKQESPMRVKQNQSDENINMSLEVILLVYSIQNIISNFFSRPMTFLVLSHYTY